MDIQKLFAEHLRTAAPSRTFDTTAHVAAVSTRDTDPVPIPGQSNLHSDTLSILKLFAAATGGEAFYNTNDVTLSLQRATRDSGSYYLLGYYRDTKDSTPGWRNVKVAVHRKGVLFERVGDTS